VLGDALKEEFKDEEEQREADVGKTFNETATRSEATQETVYIISKKKAAIANNRTEDSLNSSTNTTSSSLPLYGGNNNNNVRTGNNNQDPTSTFADTSLPDENDNDNDNTNNDIGVETDVDRIIDSHDNEYVLSKANEDGGMSLTLDYQFVRDLTVLVCASAIGGFVMELVGQPTINGYFIAGSLIGPGGLNLVKEIVQVQSMAQLGVQLLLFMLGMEFNLTKLRAVRDVSILGGAAQILCLAAVGGFGAKAIGSSGPLGAFLGALLAMSSTSIVVKCLGETGRSHNLPGQITIGTLVLQDCVVGLLFASMPVLVGAVRGSRGGLVDLAAAAWTVFTRLGAVVMVAFIVSRVFLQRAAKALSTLVDNEVQQMMSLAFCFVAAMTTARLGISAELGAFLAGVMMSSTDQGDTVLHLVKPMAQFFLALFISSTGLILAPRFLLHHLPVLAAGVMVVIAVKTVVIGGIVMLFRYPIDTALSVGINLAQVGEMAFVLLSAANGMKLVANEVYLLCMGTCALSLLATPFLLQVSARLGPKGRNGDLETQTSGPLVSRRHV
jgi:Kef-type K+ transport system membrane component KefB